MTAVLLAFALLFGTVECKASCALDICEKAPPCHGQKTVRACSHELVLQRAPAVAAVVAIPSIVVVVETTVVVGRAERVQPASFSIFPPLRI